MKKVALCFRGKSNYFLNSVDNIKSHIIDNLKENYDVDIFIYTYKDDVNEALIHHLNPVKIAHFPDEYLQRPYGSGMYGIVQVQVKDCCNIVKTYENENNVTYDYVIITRFDLTFNNKFSEYNIDYNKINMECMFVPDYNSGDNFFLIPRIHLNSFIDSVELNIRDNSNSHQLYIYFHKNNLETHYICGETSKRNPEYDIMFRFTRYLI